MAKSVNMNDTEVFSMWLTLHEKRVRELRDQYERETGDDVLFKEFGYRLYLAAQDILEMNFN